jgi:predicted Ser/Thr protein kinase
MARVHSPPAAAPSEDTCQLLKQGRLGTVSRISTRRGEGSVSQLVERDTRTARWGLRTVARRLAAREAQVLALLAGVPQVPKLAGWDGRCLRRSWLDGASLQPARPLDRAYFREALRLVRRLHALGIAHNDLARTGNWLVTTEGRPALVGFGHAVRVRYRGWRFRALACADVRDLLEQRRAHCADALTARQRAWLSRRRSWIERTWLWLARPARR